MSLEYYLLCKKNYDNIISDLKDIIDNYNEIFYYTSSELDIDENIKEAFSQNRYKNFFSSKITHISHLRNICCQKIMELCNHEYINDTIDIDPDRSQTITYCRVCEYTKP